jgi:hypothetical protein
VEEGMVTLLCGGGHGYFIMWRRAWLLYYV